MNDRSPVAPGTVLAGKYRVERVLGKGGMGIVVAAERITLGDRVALKFLLGDAAKRPDVVARFLREARAQTTIKSEHAVRVLDTGSLDDGAPYLVMELLDGHDLADELRKHGRVPVTTAVDYVLQACEALAEAHAAGIVHRDIKPANLFLARRADGSALVKVLDFGIAKTIPTGDATSLTLTSTVMGSPLYMSPEQVRSTKHIDARSDIWSLGVMLHELIAGKPAFEADTASELMAKIAADPPTLLRARRPEAPEGLELAILRCLEKDATKRTSNVAQFARDLAPFASPRGLMSIERIVGTMLPGAQTVLPSTPPPAEPVQATPNGGANTAPTWAKTDAVQPASPRRSRLSTALAVVGALSIVAVTGVVVLSRTGGGRSSSSGQSAAPSPTETSTALAVPTSSPEAPPAAPSATPAPSASAAPPVAASSAGPVAPAIASARRPGKPGTPGDPMKSAMESRK